MARAHRSIFQIISRLRRTAEAGESANLNSQGATMTPRTMTQARVGERRVVVSMTRTATYGLGLCNEDRVISPAQRAELEEDMARLQFVRREAEANSANIRLS